MEVFFVLYPATAHVPLMKKKNGIKLIQNAPKCRLRKCPVDLIALSTDPSLLKVATILRSSVCEMAELDPGCSCRYSRCLLIKAIMEVFFQVILGEQWIWPS